jgi:citrate lyase subunit beta/citryl-CoA lyase
LSVPGSSDRMVAKAPGLAADMVFLDLEDAVAAAAKEEARSRVVQAVRHGEWGDRVLSVRINNAASPWALDDVIAVVRGAGDRLDSVMLPKCASAAQVHWLDLTLTALEASQGLVSGAIAIELQIEDAGALTMVEAICAASTRTVALHFGPGDFQASLGIPSVALGGTDGPDPLHHALGRLLVAGRAYGLQVLDGPYPVIADVEGLERGAARVAAMGFDGKWVLHPDQIAVVNAAFTPPAPTLARAQRVLDAYEAATIAGTGAILLDGEMIDEATRAMAQVVVARGRAAGLA